MYAYIDSETEQLVDLIGEQVKFEICRTLNSALMSRPQRLLGSCRGVGTRGAQGHVSPQYFEQLVVVTLQYFEQILGMTKWVPPQYLTPSYGPSIL